MDLNPPEDFLEEYIAAANSRNFDLVRPLVSSDAVFWFSDGSYSGIEEIRKAFEKTWSAIRNEQYTISRLEWLFKSNNVAVCIYNFMSVGETDMGVRRTIGRGTNVLMRVSGSWKVIHEHLSLAP